MKIRQSHEIGMRRLPATAETVNADLRTYRGLSGLGVRGLNKVRCVALGSALAYDLMHFGSALRS